MRALICTIGQRDLTIGGRTAEDCGKRGKIREFGADLRRRYVEVSGEIAAPIIDRALEYLRDGDGLPDEVILVATDQPKESPHHAGDTCEVAEVIKRYVEERHRPKKVWVKCLKDNPSNLDTVMITVAGWLRNWAKQYDRMELVLTGGTPGMTNGVLLSALEVCPERIAALYVAPDGGVRDLDVVRRVRAGQSERDFVLALQQHHFGSALLLFEQDSEAFELPPSVAKAIKALLRSAPERLSFRLPEARQSLAEAQRTTRLPDDLYPVLTSLLQGFPGEKDSAGLLHELFYNAGEKLRHEEYADFVLRLFNLHQAALRQAAERAGVMFQGDADCVADSWLEAEPGFTPFAHSWPYTRSHGVTLDIKRGGRLVLLCLAAYLSEKGTVSPEVSRNGERLDPLAQLRNKCFAAHDFEPVDRSEVERRFAGSIEDVVEAMTALCRAATNREIAPNPFEQTVDLCQRLLHRQGRR